MPGVEWGLMAALWGYIDIQRSNIIVKLYLCDYRVVQYILDLQGVKVRKSGMTSQFLSAGSPVGKSQKAVCSILEKNVIIPKLLPQRSYITGSNTPTHLF